VSHPRLPEDRIPRTRSAPRTDRRRLGTEDAVMYTALAILVVVVLVMLVGMVIVSNGWLLIPILLVGGFFCLLKFTKLGWKVDEWLS